MVKAENQTKEDIELEARILCMKLIINPSSFTLLELCRLQEIIKMDYVVD